MSVPLSPDPPRSPSPVTRDARQPVLLYDVSCGLCHRVVCFLLRRDSAGRLHFAPLQSPPAQAFLRAQGLPTREFDTLVFVSDWRNQTAGAYHLRTDGALGAVAELGGGWRALAWLRVIPRAFRDGAYRLVARFRHALFGTYQPAPLPVPEWKDRFLAR